MKAAKNAAETAIGVDLDGDGQIGAHPTSAPVAQGHVEAPGAPVAAAAPAAATHSAKQEHSAHGASQVLFFPDEKMPCRAMGKCTRKGCDFAHQPTSLSRMLDVLHSAKHTLDVCVFNITANEIADALSEIRKRGVTVRIITDDEQRVSQGSDIRKLSPPTLST